MKDKQIQNDKKRDEAYIPDEHFSPQEINAYKEHFPACDSPVNVHFADGSKNCMCVFGAIGHYGQTPCTEISVACALCPHFAFRQTPLEDMNYEYFLACKDFVIKNQVQN